MERSVLVAPQLCAAAVLDFRSPSFGTQLDPSDAALYALTDFQREPPITVGPDRLIDNALGDMSRLDVEALLVASGRPQEGHAITGLITAADISKRLQSKGADRLMVRDVMTPVGELPLVHFESLQALTAYDVFTLFQGTGLTHLLVVEHNEIDGQPVARGLLSRNLLGLRLNHAAVRVLHG